jgi:hypothetical protein
MGGVFFLIESVWPSIIIMFFLEPATADELTTDRRIMFFSTYLSGRQAPFRAIESGRVDDGQTNYVLLTESVWPSSVVPSQRKRMG